MQLKLLLLPVSTAFRVERSRDFYGYLKGSGRAALAKGGQGPPQDLPLAAHSGRALAAPQPRSPRRPPAGARAGRSRAPASARADALSAGAQVSPGSWPLPFDRHLVLLGSNAGSQARFPGGARGPNGGCAAAPDRVRGGGYGVRDSSDLASPTCLPRSCRPVEHQSEQIVHPDRYSCRDDCRQHRIGPQPPRAVNWAGCCLEREHLDHSTPAIPR